MDDEAIVVGICAECQNQILNSDNVYVDDENRYFCCAECALEYHEIIRVER